MLFKSMNSIYVSHKHSQEMTCKQTDPLGEPMRRWHNLSTWSPFFKRCKTLWGAWELFLLLSLLQDCWSGWEWRYVPAAGIYGNVVSSMKCLEFGLGTSWPLHYTSTALCIFVIILMNNVSYCLQRERLEEGVREHVWVLIMNSG